MHAFSRASRCFWLILGGYDVQFEGFGGDYVFLEGSAQREGRRYMHVRIPEIKINQITTGAGKYTFRF